MNYLIYKNIKHLLINIFFYLNSCLININPDIISYLNNYQKKKKGYKN